MQVLRLEVPPVVADRSAVRFAVVGDPGLPEATAVPAAVAQLCGFDSQPRCDFTLVLGDNLYRTGIRRRREAEDRKRLERIVAPYRARPVFLTLGNHDWHPQFPRRARAERQLRWIAETELVRGSAHFYEVQAGPVHLWCLDTNYLVRRRNAASDPRLAAWLDGIERSGHQWRIVFGHHPYRSNGHHGNAGTFRDHGLRLWPGKGFRDLLEKRVLPHADLYLAGHEHTLQFFVENGERGAATAVVGSTAKCSGRAKRPANPGRSGVAAAFESYRHGFAVVEADRDRLRIGFHDRQARELWWAERRSGEPGWRYAPARYPLDDAAECR